MKKGLANILINKLEKTNLPIDDVEFVLSKDEKILKKLALLDKELFNVAIDIILMYKDDHDIITAIELLTNAREKVLPYLIKTLTNAYLEAHGLIMESAKIISESKDDYNVPIIYEVLTDKYLIESGIALGAARIINESKEEYNADYIWFFLTSRKVREAKMALAAARIINESKTEYNADYALRILLSENAIKAGIALEGARIVNEVKDKDIAEYVYRVFTNENAIKMRMAHKYAGIICHAKNREVAYFTCEFLLGETTVSLDSEERLSIASEIATFSEIEQITKKGYMGLLGNPIAQRIAYFAGLKEAVDTYGEDVPAKKLTRKLK